MTTLRITLLNNNPAIMQALDGWCRMGEIFIEESPGGNETAEPANEKFERIPGLPYTREERIASVRQAMADYRAGGRTYTTEELRERMTEW